MCVWLFLKDIVTDIGAHQRCEQLLLNEGDLQIYRQSGDVDNSNLVFIVTGVPEVFNTFDELSYHMSLMDLSAFRQSAMGQRTNWRKLINPPLPSIYFIFSEPMSAWVCAVDWCSGGPCHPHAFCFCLTKDKALTIVFVLVNKNKKSLHARGAGEWMWIAESAMSTDYFPPYIIVVVSRNRIWPTTRICKYQMRR